MIKKIKSKLFVMGTTVVTVLTVATATCFAEDTATAPGSLPPEVTATFSTLATGLIVTIGVVSALALGVFAAPQALVFAKKVFKRISA